MTDDIDKTLNKILNYCGCHDVQQVNVAKAKQAIAQLLKEQYRKGYENGVQSK